MSVGIGLRTGEVHAAYDRLGVGDLAFPVVRGMRGMWWLGGSEEFSEINRCRANGYGNAEVVGSPVFQAAYASFVGGQDIMLLPFPNTPRGTIWFLARPTGSLVTDADRPVYVGTSPGQGVSIYFGTPTTVRIIEYDEAGSVSASNNVSTPGALTDWRILSARWEPGANGVKMTDHSVGGDTGTATMPGTTTKVSSNRMSIGGNPGTGYTGGFDMACLGYHSVVLTDAELASIVAKIKPMQDLRGNVSL